MLKRNSTYLVVVCGFNGAFNVRRVCHKEASLSCPEAVRPLHIGFCNSTLTLIFAQTPKSHVTWATTCYLVPLRQ